MISKGISVVQVNPYAVKQTKEIEDNSQLKDDRKDPKLIANLVKDGNYGMPYLPEKVYAELRRLSMFREQLMEDRNRHMNRLHREMKIYFPEYKDAFEDRRCILYCGPERSAVPGGYPRLGAEGLRDIWHKAKLRGRGYSRAEEIVKYAETSIGLEEGTAAGKEAVRWFAEKITELDEELAEIENKLEGKCGEIPMRKTYWRFTGLAGRSCRDPCGNGRYHPV